jgi:hypothetical protein
MLHVTDYWSRPGGSGQPDFEIEVFGAVGSSFLAGPPAGDGDQPSRRGWGAIAGLVALGAIALVIGAGVVIEMTSDDGEDTAEPASTTILFEPAAPVATSPPETVELGELGDFDMPETRYPPMVSSPTPLQQQIPGFPVVPGSAGEDLSAYDLEAAVANNMPGAEPQRSMFNIVGSDSAETATTEASEPQPIRATAAIEPGAARDALTMQYGGDTSRIVVDRAAQTVYIQRAEDDGAWRSVEPREFIAGTGTESLNELFDAFVTGPITTDALAHGTITPSDGLMRIMGGGYARRFDVEVPIEYLRPYGALLFANITDSAVDGSSAPDSITFQIYVAADAHLALVTSNFTVGPQTFVLSQFFDRRPANVRIELPTVVLTDDLRVPTTP